MKIKNHSTCAKGLLWTILVTIGAIQLLSASGCSPDASDAKETKLDSCRVTSHLYAVIDGDSLALDLYRHFDSVKPLVIFVHGGGFMGGSRNHPFIASFCDSLSNEGFHVASISYRLFLKGKTFGCEQSIAMKLEAFDHCAEDIFKAYSYLIKHADELNIEAEQVILCGSSAGAEGILDLAFNPKFEHIPVRGLISMAGALTDTTFIREENALPTLFFHGLCDPLVPYYSAYHHYCPEDSPGALLLYGSMSISDRLNTLKVSNRLIFECGGDHSISNRAMTEYFEEIVLFCHQVFSNKLPKSSTRVVRGAHSCECPACTICP